METHSIVLAVISLLILIFITYKLVRHTLKAARAILRKSRFYTSSPVADVEVLVMPILQGFGYVGLIFLASEAELLDWRYILTILTYKVICISGYYISRTRKREAGPLLLVILSVVLLFGIILFGVIFIHFSPLLVVSLFTAFMPPLLLFTFLPILSLLLGCILFTVELIALIRYNQKRGLKNLKQKSGLIYEIVCRYYFENRYSFWIILFTLPLFITVIQLILLVFGQAPDSAIKAITESSDGLFSRGRCEKCPPPPSHYLCTIGATGSKSLVNPLRYGFRNGEKFPLTRQLMICNAFEEVLSKKFPRLQQFLRKGYDRLDIPVNRWSRNRCLANFFYIATKPLEWLFLIALYLFVPKPENLIHRQYLEV